MYEKDTQDERKKSKSGKIGRSLLGITGLCLAIVVLYSRLTVLMNDTTNYIGLRFDNLNENNTVYLASDRNENVLNYKDQPVVYINNEGINISDNYLQQLNLYGYTGPVTLLIENGKKEYMITYNDGKAYFSNKFRVTLADSTPVEFIHNLASSNLMDVEKQEGKTFTVVFRKRISLAEYKAKIDELRNLSEITSVEKIYLTMEGAVDANNEKAS